jgi:hypothetical protein
LDKGLTNPTITIIFVAKYLQGPRKWTDSLAQPKHRKNGYEIWHVECHEPLKGRLVENCSKGGSGKYKLDLVGVQEVRCEKGSNEREEDYKFFLGKRE